MTSLISITIGSLLDVIHGYLPYRVWLPYDSNIAVMFWITSVQQIVTVIFATVISVAQIEIFQNRIHKLIISKTATHMKHSFASSNTRSSLFSEFIRHHLGIYQLVISKSILHILTQSRLIFIYIYQLLTYEIAFVTYNTKLIQIIITDMPKN